MLTFYLKKNKIEKYLHRKKDIILINVRKFKYYQLRNDSNNCSFS